MSMDAPVVRRGALRCPDCDGQIVGLVDVTVHPTIRVRDGQLETGPITDTRARINRGARDLMEMALDDEVYCHEGCGYRTNARALRAHGLVT